MKLNLKKQVPVIPDTNLGPPNRQWRSTFAVALTLMMGSVAVPASGWAASINMYRFVDDGDNAYNGEPSYSEPSVIFLKHSGATNPSYIVLTNGEYQGYPISPDNTYIIWQFINPASLATLGMSLDQIPWSSEATALNLIVDANDNIQVNDPNSSFSTSGQDSVDIYFPFPNSQNDDEINLKKQELEGKCATPDIVLCGYNPDDSHSYPSECNSYPPNIEVIWLTEDSNFDHDMVKNNWNNNYYPSSSLKEAIDGKVVLTYGVVMVPYYASTNPISVLGMCNYGTLKSPVGAQALIIEFEDATDDGMIPKDENFFANFGKVEGSAPPSPNNSNCSISLKGKDVILEGTFSPFEMLGINVFSGTFYNEGIIQGGNSVNFVDGNFGCYIDDPYGYFEQQTSTGGSVTLSFSGVYEKGSTSGGDGFSAHYQDYNNVVATQRWDESTQQYTDELYGAGKGGNVTLEGTNLIASLGSFVKGGDGGDVTADNICEECSIEVKGGIGGTVTVNFGEELQGFGGFEGGSIYFDPDIMLSGKETHFKAEEDLVIFGGEDWHLKLNNLSEKALVAGRNIILAVGDGGTIDLRGNNSKIFEAGGKVEIYADNVLLDQGVQLEDLIQASEIIRGPNKIIYRVVLNAQDLQGQAQETVSVELKVSNAGPKEDTYTLSVVSEKGNTISGLPSSITIEGLKHKKLLLNVTLSEIQGATDTITITATSQADSTVVAKTKILVNVAEDVGKPKAAFTASPISGDAPLVVSLDANGSNDPDGTIDNYTWTASNGNTATGATASMTFTEDGVYVIVLTVTDNDGKTATAEHTISVGGCEGHATYSANNGFLHIPYVNMPTVPMIGGNHTPSQKTAMVEATLQLIDASNLFEIEEINWLPLAVTETGQCHANYSLDGKLHIPYIDVPLVTILNGVPVPLGVDTYDATLQLIPFSDLFTIESVTPIP